MPASDSTHIPPAIDSRFELVRLLGSGGVASVYEVFDRGMQRRVALKRLQQQSDPQRQRRLVELLEREFYTLSQLAHPAIVRAYDYGIDGAGPYYTMELLEGTGLQALGPLPYKRACLLARDICSALSLLHSRRLIYRDLNPRNVQCDAQGAPKLIDFGAIAAMGPCQHVVGTPAYCAPEALDLQPLDARADLFSLGATLYYALTGQHAFPAKTFVQARQLWGAPPVLPSTIVPDIPASLDALVLALMKFDPAARPPNAGELMEHLTVIAGQTLDEQAGVTQAYLSTPHMVGREPQLAQWRAHLQQTMHGHGAAVLVASASGAGRTRMLAACQLEAKLAGAVVAYAAARDASEDYGVIRALGYSLLDAAPELARRAAGADSAVLEHVMPRLAPGSGAPSAARPQRPQVLTAIRAWLTRVSHERPLLLAVDDFHRADEPSAACISLIARVCHAHALLLLASSEIDAGSTRSAAVKLFESSASRLWLRDLSEADTGELLRSVFGAIPNLPTLRRKVYATSSGNPRDTLHVAQNLVDRGVAKYRAGAWSLAAGFDVGWLPDSMHQAIVREVAALPRIARALARVLSLADDRPRSFVECARSSVETPTQLVHDALLQLLQSQLIKVEGERYTVAHRGLHDVLRGGADAVELHAVHSTIAKLFASRGSDPFRHAKHLLAAGETSDGIDALVAFAVSTQERTDNDPNEYVRLVRSMPDDWLDVFDSAIAACDRLARRRIDTFRLRNRLAGLLNVMGATSHVHLLALIHQLCHDSGLHVYAALDPALPPAERLKRALEEATQRYASSTERERVFEPRVAMRYLVRSLILAAGLVALGLDYALWRALPSIAPLEPLSPAFGLIERLVAGVAARVAGRLEEARAVYTDILDRLEQPDNAGLDASNHRFLRFGVMYGAALVEASMGLSACIERAVVLETEPLHSVNALQVRVVYALWSGNAAEADELRERVELRRLQSGARQMADGSHLMWQMIAHVYSDDVMRLKHAIDDLTPLAQRHVAWGAVLGYALAEQQRMRGEHALALEGLSAVFDRVAVGSHAIWPHLVASQIRALCALDRAAEAVQLGEAQLLAAHAAGLGYLAHYIRMALALACGSVGQHERSLALARAALHGFQRIGSSGLDLVLAYEAYSRAAFHAGRLDEGRRLAERCAELCRAMSAGALHARSERLLRLHPPGTADVEAAGAALESAFACETAHERAVRALQLLLFQCGAESGVLYLVKEKGPARAALVGDEPSPEVTARMLALLEAEARQQEVATVSADHEGEAYSFVLLCHQATHGPAVTGMAALTKPVGRFLLPVGALAARLSRMLAEKGDVVPHA